MVWVTFLFPTKCYYYCSSAFAHTKHLDSSSFKQQSFYSKQSSGNIQSKQQVQLRTVHQNKRKVLKERERIELAATVTRTQETRKTELRLKRKTAIEIFVKQKNYKFHLF